MYGNQVESITGPRAVVGSVETAPAGNVVLRIGKEAEGGWYQTGHVVLTQAEAWEVVKELLAAANG